MLSLWGQMRSEEWSGIGVPLYAAEGSCWPILGVLIFMHSEQILPSLSIGGF